MIQSTRDIYLNSPSIAVPTCKMSQEESYAFLQKNYSSALSPRSKKILKKLFSNSSIRKRHFAFREPDCLLREGPDQRINRFTKSAADLASRALKKAISSAKMNPDEVTGLVVNTCTGYLCPGLSSYLIEKLDLPANTPSFDLVGSGCGGALPNLQMSGALARETGGTVLSAAVEICSATFQMEDDLSLLLSNTLFADGAAAALVKSSPGDWHLISSASRHDPRHREAIRYIYRNGQLYNQLYTSLPDIIGEIVPEVVSDFLQKENLSFSDIKYWCLHTGGEKIINILQEKLNLSNDQLLPSRNILSEYGNLSSPTVLFVFNEINKREIPSGEKCLLLSFGAGLSVHTYLLQKS